MTKASTPTQPPHRSSQRRGQRPATGRGRLLALGAVLAVAAIAALSVSSISKDSSSATAGPAGLAGADFHSLVADPTTPGRLFVGGHQSVSVSTDSGRTWRRVASLDNADAMGWSFINDAIYVSGHPGINRSTDGAATFRRTNNGLPDTDIHAFGASRSTLYAAGPNVGVIASTDGGATWTPRSLATGKAFFGRILTGLADGQLIAADAHTGVVESSDGGRTWRPLGGPQGAVWVSRSGLTLYVSAQRGIARTADGGVSWEPVTVPQGAALLEADPTEPDLLYVGTHAGDSVTVQISRDGGATWVRP